MSGLRHVLIWTTLESVEESKRLSMPLTSFKPPSDRRAHSRWFFDPWHGSLVRGSVLVLGSFFAAIAFSGVSATHTMPLLTIPAVLAVLGTLDTARCMHGRWTLYQAGVYFLLLMDLMAMCLILFFLVTPYVI